MAPIGITRYPFSGKACFCIAPKDTPRRFSLCRMITNLKIKRSRTRKESSVYRLLASRRTNPNHWRYAFGARRDSNPRKESFTGSKSKRSSGIHFGISSCTAVKDRFKHTLEVTLQAYFTNPYTVFHGKKAANSYLSPQLSCFSSFSMTNFLKGSGSKTSIIGPKERIRITISDSSS